MEFKFNVLGVAEIESAVSNFQNLQWKLSGTSFNANQRIFIKTAMQKSMAPFRISKFLILWARS